MNQKRFYRDERGFTLLEVMIAVAVLAGVLVTVIATVNSHLTVVANDKDIVEASLLGRVKAEEVAIFGIDEGNKGAMEGRTGKFTWSLSGSSTAVKDLRRIGIKVQWDGDRYVEFTSYRELR